MKATELRIGNWVNINGWDCDVAEISTNQIHISNGIEPYLLEYEVEPIPLTKEWLERFGFEREEEYYEGGMIDYRMILMKNSLEFVSFWESEDITGVNQCQTGVDVDYVHQLQNLYFALTGEELELKP